MLCEIRGPAPGLVDHGARKLVRATDGGLTMSTAPPADSFIGEVLAGRYKITRKIGEGGMGAVYEAEHQLIGKRVAVKVLLDKFAGDKDVVARLQHEARIASSIGHPSIVDVTDFGKTPDGRSYAIMEYLEGEALASLIAREAPLPPERVLPIVKQIANALGAAHRKGIVHRDVKPENVFLVRDGQGPERVKVVDFGISKLVKSGDPAQQRLTQTGIVLGTPLYMSPEQARGEEQLDHRVDVYALGVILYEALTGEVPFRGSNYLGVISQVLTLEPVPPRVLRPELSITEALERVVMRTLAKDRDVRYQTMAELEHDIDRLAAGDQNVGLMPSGVPVLEAAAAEAAREAASSRRVRVAALVGLLLAGAGLAAMGAGRDHVEAPPDAAPRVELPDAPRAVAAAAPDARPTADAARSDAARDHKDDRRRERLRERAEAGERAPRLDAATRPEADDENAPNPFRRKKGVPPAPDAAPAP